MNAGMWMWLSCSSFFQQFFHCYCPVRFGRKADPNGEFIRYEPTTKSIVRVLLFRKDTLMRASFCGFRKYLPVLKNFPNNFIHEPWMAPESVQKSAKCIVGEDYPKPMINHAVASRINMERMRQVYMQLPKFQNEKKNN